MLTQFCALISHQSLYLYTIHWSYYSCPICIASCPTPNAILHVAGCSTPNALLCIVRCQVFYSKYPTPYSWVSYFKCPTPYKCALLCVDTTQSVALYQNPTLVGAVALTTNKRRIRLEQKEKHKP